MEESIRTNSLNKENESMSLIAYPLLMTKKSLVIFSMNSVIAHILNKYLNKFKNKEIYFAVDKPGRAVIILMKKLSRSGQNVHLIAEKDLISYLDEWEALCSGAEFICKNGVGSTQGMDVIAKICKKCKKSYYIFAGSNVFIMKQVKSFASQCIIPFHNVTYLLTERRLYTSQDIIAYFSGPLHGS